jgi:hypothetical protein
MGSEVVCIYIGLGKAEFSIHKQLLLSAGQIFKASERVTLGKEDPAVFKLFVEFLYTNNVPNVHPSMSAPANDERLANLCKLYAFANKFRVVNRIANRIMDAIQDGFRFVNKLPDLHLVRTVYEHTMPGSKLRAFCIASILHALPARGDGVRPEAVTGFLGANKDALREFVLAVRRVELLGRDPRVRDCEGARGCVECRAGERDRLGSWPCRFHVHAGSGKRVVKREGSDGGVDSPSSSVRGDEDVEECYLWDSSA